MDVYLKATEVDGLRLKGESDEQWEIRQRFILRHLESFSKNRLLCLSQLFININFLGCVYNANLMQEVRGLSDGILEEVVQNRKKKFEEGFVKASEAKRAKIVKTSEPSQSSSSEAAKKNKFVVLKAQSGITDKGLEPLQRLNQTTARAKVGWQLKDVDGLPSLFVDEVLVLSHKFLASKTLEAKQYAAAATLHAINADNVDIRAADGRYELWRGDCGPASCYMDYLKNVLHKAFKALPSSGSSEKRLEIGFKTAAVPLLYKTKQGTGWEQEISFWVLNVVLDSKMLRKADCTKSKENEHKEALAAAIITTLSDESFQLEEAEDCFKLQRKV